MARRRSTRDLLNILDTIAKAGAGFRSLADTWADTTTLARPAHADCARRPCRIRARADPRQDRAKGGSARKLVAMAVETTTTVIDVIEEPGRPDVVVVEEREIVEEWKIA